MSKCNTVNSVNKTQGIWRMKCFFLTSMYFSEMKIDTQCLF